MARQVVHLELVGVEVIQLLTTVSVPDVVQAVSDQRLHRSFRHRNPFLRADVASDFRENWRSRYITSGRAVPMPGERSAGEGSTGIGRTGELDDRSRQINQTDRRPNLQSGGH